MVDEMLFVILVAFSVVLPSFFIQGLEQMTYELYRYLAGLLFMPCFGVKTVQPQGTRVASNTKQKAIHVKSPEVPLFPAQSLLSFEPALQSEI